MSFIEPLNLQLIIWQIFAGSPDIFLAVAIFVIAIMSAYFRMNGIAMFFMLSIFILMFSNFVDSNLLIVFGTVGGLIIGYILSRFVR